MTRVEQIISDLADRAEVAGVARDAEVNGSLHRFALAQGCPPAKTFFVVFLLAGELADREARREGFLNQGDRAAQRMREKFPVKS